MKATKTGAGLPDKLKQRQHHRSELIGKLWVHDVLVDFIKRLLWVNIETQNAGSDTTYTCYLYMYIGFLTTVSCCMEDGCLGYPGSSTVTSHPPESIMLPWLAILQPDHVPPCSLPGTCHTELIVEKGGGGGGEQKDVEEYR